VHPLRGCLPLLHPLDAVEALLALLDDDPTTTLVALVDHLPGGVRVALPVDGGDPGPAGAGALDDLLLHLLAEAPGARVVLATVRAGEDLAVAEDDLAMWRTLVARHRGSGVTLLDWFVLTDDAVVSLAELAGPRARWAG
jgi:hypothetical protein